MTAAELLRELRRRGVKLTVNGDRLRYEAPRGALTPELLEAMRQHKPELMRMLARPPIPPDLASQVEAALRRGQWVRVETDFGDIILAPNRRAAERAAQRHPGLPIFRPAEWKELLACETPEELAVLIELKRTLGADLIRAEPVEREGVSP